MATRKSKEPQRTTEETVAWMEKLRGAKRLPDCADGCTCRLCRAARKLQTKAPNVAFARAREIAADVLYIADMGATKVEILPLTPEDYE